MIDYTSLAVKAASISPKNDIQAKKLEKIVPEPSRLKGEEICVYQIRDGKIMTLEKYDDMPSDDNFLNKELSDTNELFGQLLELEDGI
jgi:hypothetical protein